MPKLKPETQTQRRDHILDVAEQCFALAGFHRATMADICREAKVSAGALYGHFDSKEALIEGLCERDRAEFAKRFETLAEAPDFLAALRALGTHFFVDEPAHKRLFVAEMAVESTRNPRIAEMYHSVDAFCLEKHEQLFARLHAEGRIAPGIATAQVARLFQLIGDGLFLRRAVHPDFDFDAIREALLTMIARLLVPTTAPSPDAIAGFATFHTQPPRPLAVSKSPSAKVSS
jgi:TetR/AcrR family transcriptional regulator, repressor for uid operon